MTFKFKIGDIVKITNPDNNYSTYKRMADRFNLENWVYGRDLDEYYSNYKYSITHVCPHDIFDNKIVYSISRVTTKEEFLMGEDGLELIDSKLTSNIELNTPNTQTIKSIKIIKNFPGSIHTEGFLFTSDNPGFKKLLEYGDWLQNTEFFEIEYEQEIKKIKESFLSSKAQLEQIYQKEIEELRWLIFNQTKAHLNGKTEEEKILWAEYQRLALKLEVATFFPELRYNRFV